MKITIDIPDESVQAFADLITGKVIGRIDQLEKAVYKSGQDDVGGKLHKDIKDIDDVADDYNHKLYSHAKELERLYLRERPEQEHILEGRIRELTGDYTVNTGLSDVLYNQLIRKLIGLCVNSDVWAYQEINKKYA